MNAGEVWLVDASSLACEPRRSKVAHRNRRALSRMRRMDHSVV